MSFNLINAIICYLLSYQRGAKSSSESRPIEFDKSIDL